MQGLGAQWTGGALGLLLGLWGQVVAAADFTLPPSELSSAEARRVAEAAKSRVEATLKAGSRPLTLDELVAREGMTALRGSVGEGRKALADALAKRFPVRIREEAIGGVLTNVVEPAEGVSAANRHRVLINLHGGGFFLGSARNEGQVGAIPVAALGGYRVVTVDYRMAPEHRFPAASEDVARVYRELLKTYRPENIGIYGCSAGATLTSQSVAWLQHVGLPRPGAISLDGAGATAGGLGDSYYIANAIAGVKTPDPPPPRGSWYSEQYFGKTGYREPLQSPAFHADVLRGFPPTLLLTGTRDQRLSTVVFTHARMVEAGVEARLHVWEGVGHCFSYNADLPEARQAYDVVVRFFDQHLGRESLLQPDRP